MRVLLLRDGRLERVSVDFYAADTVWRCKERIAKATGIVACEQRLCHRFAVLDNERALASYGITAQSTLELCIVRCASCRCISRL